MSIIHHLAEQISRLEPGQRIGIDRDLLDREQSIPMVGMCGPSWSPCDQIMEKIIGSAYEFRYWEEERGFTFERLREPLTNGVRTYVSPDRRDRFTEVDGQFVPALG